MTIQPPAHRQREPRAHVDVVLHEQAGRGEGVGEPRNIGGTVGIVLDRGPGDPRMPSGRSPHRELGEARAVAISLPGLPEPVVVRLLREGGAGGDDGAPGQRLPQGAEVLAARVEGLPVGGSRGRQDAARRRAAGAGLAGRARREEQRPALPVVPEEPRPHDAAAVTGHVRPPVAVDVREVLPVAAAEQGHPPRVGQRRRQPQHAVGRAPRRPVEQELPLRLVAGPPRQQVDDAAHGARPVERGSDPLDHLHLPEVHRRDL